MSDYANGELHERRCNILLQSIQNHSHFSMLILVRLINPLCVLQCVATYFAGIRFEN
jgi:hypothetical protein